MSELENPISELLLKSPSFEDGASLTFIQLNRRKQRALSDSATMRVITQST